MHTLHAIVNFWTILFQNFIYLKFNTNRITIYSPYSIHLGLPCGSADKESACIVGNLGSIPGLGRSPGERKGYPLPYSGLENSIDCIQSMGLKSQTPLSNFHFTSSVNLLLFLSWKDLYSLLD